MAKNPDAATKDLNESRAEALSAILQSLSPGAGESSGSKLSPEQVRKISDKLGDILGDQGGSGEGIKHNEKGELINDEGLPIIDISEPVTTDQPGSPVTSGQFDDPDILPLWTLSPAERARRKVERERILDLLEEEERQEEQRDEAEAQERMRDEMEKRKEAAQKEMDSLKKARELQKKMGRALMRSVVETREKEEKEKAELVEKDRLTLETKIPKRKSVSFADDIDEDGRVRSDKGKSSREGRQPMKMHVVERHPRSLIQSGLVREPDSDDESDPGSANDSAGESSTGQAPPDSDEDEDDAPVDEEISEWNGEDFDHAQHQREIALEYYEKRRTFGAEAASAMRAHSHDEDEWDQPEVPLEATLAHSPPRSSTSRFKANREARHAPQASSLASHSLGASVVPSSSSSAMKRAVRMGRLENGKLVGEDDESGDEVDANTRALLEALRRGEVTNIGPAARSRPVPPSADSTQSTENVSSGEHPNPSNTSKFKLSVTHPTEDPASISPSSSRLPTPVTVDERSSPKPSSPAFSVSEENTASTSQQPRFTLPPQLQSALASGQIQMPGMIVDSPSFLSPHGATHHTHLDVTSPISPMSASSTLVGTPTSPELSSVSPVAPMRQTVVERRPVAAGSASSAEATTGARPAKVSRFKAQRA